MNETYYQPANVFRQPAIFVKKSESRPNSKSLGIGTHRKSWQNNVARLGSPLLRKASSDMNDYYTTQQLQSEYWGVNAPIGSRVTSLSCLEDKILVSNSNSTENLKLYELNQGSSKSTLRTLQVISVPDKPPIVTCLLPDSFKSTSTKFSQNDDCMILTGNQDGYVDLITTSATEGNAKIVKRFNHGKYLKSTNQQSLDAWLRTKRSLPIRQLQPWNDQGFMSIVNETVFIYDLNHHRSPLYLQSFNGLEAAAHHVSNPHLLSLVGSRFGENGISLLDLRSGQGYGNLYSPDIGDSTNHSKSTRCTWLDEYTIANTVGNCVKLWDVRAPGAKCTIKGHKGSINSLQYHSELKRLYTGDDQGYAIAWDLTNLENVSECRLANGFQSILSEKISELKQCGNIVVTPDSSHISRDRENTIGHARCSNFLSTTDDGSLITLDSVELGLHSIREVERPISIPVSQKQPESASYTHYSTGEAADSDTTLHQDSLGSTWEETSDGTVDMWEFQTPVQNTQGSKVNSPRGHKAHNPSLYSLTDNLLSGSTIYDQTSILNVDILV
ncbi:LAMI_0D07096g1_1 [Lachancea mirantina]|uniref:LAMI_0D07096g1_1 n=1 Tax=Lachancea mirantina TaxID=1230905 RepID=A0A1G4JCS0_9SACH|nr:LAMI_0D07096g1_1 [Lachancea mirantina]